MLKQKKNPTDFLPQTIVLSRLVITGLYLEDPFNLCVSPPPQRKKRQLTSFPSWIKYVPTIYRKGVLLFHWLGAWLSWLQRKISRWRKNTSPCQAGYQNTHSDKSSFPPSFGEFLQHPSGVLFSQHNPCAGSFNPQDMVLYPVDIMSSKQLFHSCKAH